MVITGARKYFNFYIFVRVELSRTNHKSEKAAVLALLSAVRATRPAEEKNTRFEKYFCGR
jgi:hypothetical protein